MEVRVKQIDGLKFSVEARSHRIICDQPLENGGQDAGMTPPEFMLGSLGACAEFYAVQYLRSRKIEDAGVDVSVTAEKLMKPARLGELSHSRSVFGPVEPGAERRLGAVCSPLPDS